jgi:hypothetical protein
MRDRGRDLIPVVLTIDVEPDGPGHDPGDSAWAGVAAVRRWVNDVRERTTERTGRPARVSWLLRCDPQVEALFGSATHVVEAEPELFAEAALLGDEVGLHIHAWRPSPDGGWVDDFGDEAWLDECIDAAFAAFAEAFGRPCRVVSMGNRFLGPAAIAGLVRNGAAVDLTGEPARGPLADGDCAHVRGALPDFRRMPRQPHHLTSELIELPLTAGRKRLGPNPRAHLSRLRRHGLRQRLDQPVQLGGKEVPGTTFAELMSDSLRRQRRPHLSFAVRSDGILDPVQRPRLVGHMDEVLALDDADRFVFMTPSEAVEALGVA